MKTFLDFLSSVQVGQLFSVYFPDETTYTTLSVFTHEDGDIHRVSVTGQYGADIMQLTLSLAHKADILRAAGRDVTSSDIVRFVKATDGIYALA